MDSLIAAYDNTPCLKYDRAGMVLIALDGDQPRVLLLRGSETGIWSFPKGQRENCDQNYALRTAIRETAEETGLQPEFHYRILSHKLRLGCRCVYWMGIAKTTLVPHISPREHDSAGWFTPDEIRQLNVNMSVRKWLGKLASDSHVAKIVRAAPSLISSTSIRATHLTAQACTSS